MKCSILLGEILVANTRGFWRVANPDAHCFSGWRVAHVVAEYASQDRIAMLHKQLDDAAAGLMEKRKNLEIGA